MRVGKSFLGAFAVGVGMLGASGVAEAQQKTFHLDRLEMPGAPDDGVVLFRPQTQQRTIFFGQLALGYQFRPLRTKNITTEQATLAISPSAAISNQFAIYGTAGFEVLDRAILSVSFPWYPIQTGSQPNYAPGSVLGAGSLKTSNFSTSGPGAGDTRLDFRFTILRSEDRKAALGAGLSIFAPSGTTTNFGGDGGTATMVMVTGEYTVKFITLVANTGFHFRPVHAINDAPGGNGLGISDEWRWALGGFIPLKDGKYRLGATIFGQTGLTGSDPVAGDTFFTKQNTPIEFDVEGRMRFGPAEHWWAGADLGTAILRGYGAPDLRVIGLIGTYVPILDSEATSPERAAERRARRRQEHMSDRDHDGIPDDIDACPDEPEDHLGNDPNDGCPLPPDRDGDGIPDQYDKCPDVPEDKDGIDDGDGCPEDDADQDGIPDAVDACPKEPGKPNPDPKKNGCPTFYKVEGNVVRILQQVHFAFGSAVILPESFPMLQEITNLLKANPGIRKMAIEGHTDNRGSADLNKQLSQDRANSVMNWLVQHGVEQNRLEAHGYGMEKPIEDNATDEGRARNRRVEFKITEEVDTNKVQKK
jgi:outer membrane protein OmpA-like peptidoglycan-associated protein